MSLFTGITSDLNLGIQRQFLLNDKGFSQGFGQIVIDFFDPIGGLPNNPLDGDTYISDSTSNGWLDNNITYYNKITESWKNIAPINGNIVWVENINELRVYDGTDWVKLNEELGVIQSIGSSTDNAVALWDGTNGNLLQDSSLLSNGSDLTIPGKLTVGGLIDPTGLELVPQAINPGIDPNNTLWLDSNTSDRVTVGSNPLLRGPASNTLNAVPIFNSTDGLIGDSDVLINGGNISLGSNSIDMNNNNLNNISSISGFGGAPVIFNDSINVGSNTIELGNISPIQLSKSGSDLTIDSNPVARLSSLSGTDDIIYSYNSASNIFNPTNIVAIGSTLSGLTTMATNNITLEQISAAGTNISMNNEIDMNTNNINNVGALTVGSTISTNNITLEQISAVGTNISMNNEIDMNTNDINNIGTLSPAFIDGGKLNNLTSIELDPAGPVVDIQKDNSGTLLIAGDVHYKYTRIENFSVGTVNYNIPANASKILVSASAGGGGGGNGDVISPGGGGGSGGAIKNFAVEFRDPTLTTNYINVSVGIGGNNTFNGGNTIIRINNTISTPRNIQLNGGFAGSTGGAGGTGGGVVNQGEIATAPANSPNVYEGAGGGAPAFDGASRFGGGRGGPGGAGRGGGGGGGYFDGSRGGGGGNGGPGEDGISAGGGGGEDGISAGAGGGGGDVNESGGRGADGFVIIEYFEPVIN